MNWKNSRGEYCERIGAALAALGYPSPVAGVTDEAEALRMVAEGLEDVIKRLPSDDHRLHLQLAERMQMEREARGEK